MESKLVRNLWEFGVTLEGSLHDRLCEKSIKQSDFFFFFRAKHLEGRALGPLSCFSPFYGPCCDLGESRSALESAGSIAPGCFLFFPYHEVFAESGILQAASPPPHLEAAVSGSQTSFPPLQPVSLLDGAVLADYSENKDVS